MVIDSDYVDNPSNEGEIILALHNIGKYPQTVYPKERLAQGIFMKYLTTDDDNASGERKGGIGSTNTEVTMQYSNDILTGLY